MQIQPSVHCLDSHQLAATIVKTVQVVSVATPQDEGIEVLRGFDESIARTGAARTIIR